jgi:glyoxylase-like metal-dependent hydrolase (beta-lactamase superfamily II)
MPAPSQISDHVWWLPKAPPDRPCLCVVAGARRTLWLDAGSSERHARELLAAAPAPDLVGLTHSDWDHVLGASALDCPVIAQELTADALVRLASADWSDEGLDERIAAGELLQWHVDDIREELPSPRNVTIVPADIIFRDRLEVDLGDVTVQLHHVGGDHAPDSTVMFVEPDRLLFLGDALYEIPSGGYTKAKLEPLVAEVRSFDAEAFVLGHSETVLSRGELEAFVAEALETAA